MQPWNVPSCVLREKVDTEKNLKILKIFSCEWSHLYSYNYIHTYNDYADRIGVRSAAFKWKSFKSTS